jgi:hypothetical protein
MAGDGVKEGTDEEIYTDARRIMKLSTTDRSSAITPEVLSTRWGIGIATAKRTLQATMQTGIRNVIAPGERKVRQRLDHLKFPNLRGSIYTDTMFSSKIKSLRGHTKAQIFTNGRGYDRFYPMKLKSDAPDTLISSIHDTGIPQIMHPNIGSSRNKLHQADKLYHTVPGPT